MGNPALILLRDHRKEDQALLAEINKHILDMKQDGFLIELDKKWFGREMAHSPAS